MQEAHGGPVGCRGLMGATVGCMQGGCGVQGKAGLPLWDGGGLVRGLWGAGQESQGAQPLD